MAWSSLGDQAQPSANLIFLVARGQTKRIFYYIHLDCLPIAQGFPFSFKCGLGNRESILVKD